MTEERGTGARPRKTAADQYRVLIGGESFDHSTLTQPRSNAGLQAALLAARGKYGHALCLCRRPPLKLQIRLREGHNFLAVWPHEGPNHALDCLFYRDTLAESAEFARRREDAPSNEATPVARSHKSSAHRAAVVEERGLGASAPPRVLQLRPLLNQLWEESRMCDWHPTWKRDWGRVRYELLKAAKVISQDGGTALDTMFIPRPFRIDIRGELDADWARFIHSLDRLPDHAGLLVAPVRSCSGLTDGPLSMQLRHMQVVLQFTDKSEEFLRGYCRQALKFLQQREKGEQSPEVMGIFLVATGHANTLRVRMGWLMAVERQTYIPILSGVDVFLVDALIKRGYTFTRLLKDSPKEQPKSNSQWLIRYVVGPDGKPVARAGLEVVGANHTTEQIRSMGAWSRHLAENGVPCWTWKPQMTRGQTQVPELPPHSNAEQKDQSIALARIALTPNVDYRYGPITKL